MVNVPYHPFPKQPTMNSHLTLIRLVLLQTVKCHTPSTFSAQFSSKAYSEIDQEGTQFHQNGEAEFLPKPGIWGWGRHEPEQACVYYRVNTLQ